MRKRILDIARAAAVWAGLQSGQAAAEEPKHEAPTHQRAEADHSDAARAEKGVSTYESLTPEERRAAAKLILEGVAELFPEGGAAAEKAFFALRPGLQDQLLRHVFEYGHLGGAMILREITTGDNSLPLEKQKMLNRHRAYGQNVGVELPAYEVMSKTIDMLNSTPEGQKRLNEVYRYFKQALFIHPETEHASPAPKAPETPQRGSLIELPTKPAAELPAPIIVATPETSSKAPEATPAPVPRKETPTPAQATPEVAPKKAKAERELKRPEAEPPAHLIFSSDYSPSEQASITEYVRWQELELAEYPNLLEKDRVKYGVRPQFSAYEALVLKEMENLKEDIRKIREAVAQKSPTGTKIKATLSTVGNVAAVEVVKLRLGILRDRVKLITTDEKFKEAFAESEAATSASVKAAPEASKAKAERELKRPEPRERIFTSGIRKEYNGHPLISLTFDDGPNTIYTPQVLDVLKERGIKATFFVQGVNIKTDAQVELLKRIVAEGHELGLHSHDHSDFKKKKESPEQVFAEQIAPLATKIKQLTGKDVRIFRPPFGNITEAQRMFFAEKGFYTVTWSDDTNDWETGAKKPSPDTITDRVAGFNLHAGDIALMHDGGGNRTNTVEALSKIIDRLQKKQLYSNTRMKSLPGFHCVTVSEILNLAPITSPFVPAPAPAEAPLYFKTPTPAPEHGAAPQRAKPVELASTVTIVPSEPPAPKAEKTPKVEKELPAGAFAFDENGDPFGWGFQNHYKYIEGDQEIDYPDLSPEFEGRNSANKPVGGMRLREKAYQSFNDLGKLFAHDAIHNPALAKIGWHATETLRTIEEQKKLRKQLGIQAAQVGFSEHHLGTTVDVADGNKIELYKWMVEYDKAIKDPTYIPHIFRKGWVTTVKKEPWHIRYVGPELAKKFWEKHRMEIINNHTKLLQK